MGAQADRRYVALKALVWALGAARPEEQHVLLDLVERLRNYPQHHALRCLAAAGRAELYRGQKKHEAARQQLRYSIQVGTLQSDRELTAHERVSHQLVLAAARLNTSPWGLCLVG